MPKPFVRAVLAACVVAGVVVVGGATPAAAYDGWDPHQCYSVVAELPDRAPVVTACVPPPDEP